MSTAEIEKPTDSGTTSGQDTFGPYSDSGVDLSLLKYMLSLPPIERLRQMERSARDVEELLEYGQKHRQAKTAADC